MDETDRVFRRDWCPGQGGRWFAPLFEHDLFRKPGSTFRDHAL